MNKRFQWMGVIATFLLFAAHVVLKFVEPGNPNSRELLWLALLLLGICVCQELSLFQRHLDEITQEVEKIRQEKNAT